MAILNIGYIKKYSKAVLFLTMAFSITCCISKRKDNIRRPDNNENLFVIDIDSAKSIDKILCSSILEPPQTIILESNSNCVVKDIHSIDIYEEKIYILDSSSNHLFVFNIDGAFLYTIGHQGKGRGEYTELSDFCIDRKAGVIFLWDPVMKMALKYDIHDRKYISSIKIDIGGYDCYSLMCYNKKLYLNRTSMELDKENYLISEIDESSGQETAKYLRANDYNHGWNLPLRLQYGSFINKNSTSPKFVELFSDTIVSFTDKGITPMIAIKSKNMARNEDVEKFAKKCIEHKDYNIFNLDPNLIFMPRCIWDMGNYISFEMMSGGDIVYILYNKITKEALKSNRFTNDYVSSKYYVAANLLFSNDIGMISVLRSDFIPYFKEEIVANGGLNNNIDNYKGLNQLEETSNPVLFFHKYKQSE